RAFLGPVGRSKGIILSYTVEAGPARTLPSARECGCAPRADVVCSPAAEGPAVSPDDTVTDWLGPLRDGDPAAGRLLWERYFHPLADVARRRLRGAAGCIADGEDVALSAFDSFCRRAADGRFPDLLDRDGLWRLLMVLTVRKAARQVRDARRRKRGGGAVVVSGDAEADGEVGLLEQVMSREPSPESAAEAAEEYRRLLD